MTTSTAVEAVAPRATVSRNAPSFVHKVSFEARAHRIDRARFPGASPIQWRDNPNSSGEPDWSRAQQPGPVDLWKRFLDIFCILLSLPVVLPLMALVAFWVKLVSRGPAIYRQERIGRNGRRFTLYKFRSMHVNADTARHSRHFGHLVQSGSPMVKLDLLCDTRLIPLGCLLRAAGLDELPQLFNVLRGDMSLVGPRPCLPDEYRFFSRSQRLRFQVLPGLTGIWQSEGKGISTFAEMNEMDGHYAKNASLLLDLAIICRTPLALFRQMRLAVKSRRQTAESAKAELDNFGAKPLGGYATQRLR